jgi:hypothetical protein
MKTPVVWRSSAVRRSSKTTARAATSRSRRAARSRSTWISSRAASLDATPPTQLTNVYHDFAAGRYFVTGRGT